MDETCILAAISFAPTFNIALSRALPIKNSRERSVPCQHWWQIASGVSVQYTLFWSANVWDCCVLFHPKTKRSRTANAVPPYMALILSALRGVGRLCPTHASSQLKRDRANVVSMWRIASFWKEWSTTVNFGPISATYVEFLGAGERLGPLDAVSTNDFWHIGKVPYETSPAICNKLASILGGGQWDTYAVWNSSGMAD